MLQTLPRPAPFLPSQDGEEGEEGKGAPGQVLLLGQGAGASLGSTHPGSGCMLSCRVQARPLPSATRAGLGAHALLLACMHAPLLLLPPQPHPPLPAYRAGLPLACRLQAYPAQQAAQLPGGRSRAAGSVRGAGRMVPGGGEKHAGEERGQGGAGSGAEAGWQAQTRMQLHAPMAHWHLRALVLSYLLPFSWPRAHRLTWAPAPPPAPRSALSSLAWIWRPSSPSAA